MERRQEQAYLDFCCQHIVEKFGNSPPDTWTNGDFIRLSGRILRKAQVYISANTLKRIFGKIKTTERYIPQAATREALAKYAGFAHWEDLAYAYEQAHATAPSFTGPLGSLHQAKGRPPILSRIIKNARLEKKLIPPVAAAILLLLAIGIWGYYAHNRNEITAGISISCKNPVGLNHHTGHFSISVPQSFSPHDSFYVDFGDDLPLMSIDNPGSFSYYYKTPGVYFVMLKYKNVWLDTTTVYVRSNGWESFARLHVPDSKVYPVNFSSTPWSHRLATTAIEIQKSGLDTAMDFSLYYTYANRTDISGDDVEMSATLTASGSTPANRCSEVSIWLSGHKSRHVMFFYLPECSRWNSYQFSEKSGYGDAEDLDHFSYDFRKGGKVVLKITNRAVDVSIGGISVYSTNYIQSIGKIQALKIGFAGVGRVDSLLLRDLKTNKTLEGNLENSSNWEIMENPGSN